MKKETKISNGHIFTISNKEVADKCLSILKRINHFNIQIFIISTPSTDGTQYGIMFEGEITEKNKEYFSGVCRGIYESMTA